MSTDETHLENKKQKNRAIKVKKKRKKKNKELGEHCAGIK